VRIGALAPWSGPTFDRVAYKHRVETPGYYHVTMRGNNKRTIFLTDRDRLVFIALLNRIATRYGWTIHAFCLMSNHYHLVMRISEPGMSKGMCELNGTYAILFNINHERINHLFGRRYWSEELESERRIFAAVRYVVRNPVRAGLVGTPDAYVWSSYQATIGLALGKVAPDRTKAIESFRKLCESPDAPGHVQRQPP
jgi:putative transposase